MTSRRRPEPQRNPLTRSLQSHSTAADLARDLNLRSVSSGWLEAIGIRSMEDVRRIGSVEICRMLKMHEFPASLNLAYTLEGALLGIHWTKVPEDVKAALRRVLGKGG